MYDENALVQVTDHEGYTRLYRYDANKLSETDVNTLVRVAFDDKTESPDTLLHRWGFTRLETFEIVL